MITIMDGTSRQTELVQIQFTLTIDMLWLHAQVSRELQTGPYTQLV